MARLLLYLRKRQLSTGGVAVVGTCVDAGKGVSGTVAAVTRSAGVAPCVMLAGPGPTHVGPPFSVAEAGRPDRSRSAQSPISSWLHIQLQKSLSGGVPDQHASQSPRAQGGQTRDPSVTVADSRRRDALGSGQVATNGDVLAAGRVPADRLDTSIDTGCRKWYRRPSIRRRRRGDMPGIFRAYYLLGCINVYVHPG